MNVAQCKIISSDPRLGQRFRSSNHIMRPPLTFKGDVVAQNIDDLHSDNNKLGMQTNLKYRPLQGGQILRFQINPCAQ